MKKRKKQLILLVVDLVIVGIVIFGFRAWYNGIPEKRYEEKSIATGIEEELTREGFEERIEVVNLIRNYEKDVQEALLGKGVGIGIGTTEFIPQSHGRFVELYLEPKNHFRDELLMLVKAKTDKETNGLTYEKQYFSYTKYYGVRSENGGSLMFVKDTYLYQEGGKYGKRFNIEKIEGDKITFVYDPRDGDIISMILLGVLITVIGLGISIYLLREWHLYG